MRKAKKTKKAEIATFLTLGLVLVGAVLSLLSGVMVNRQKNIASNPRAQSTQTTCTIDQKCGSGNHWLCKPNYTTVTFNGINFDGNGCDPNRCPTKELPFACYVVDDRCDKGKIRYRWYGCKGQPCENTVINQGTHGPGKLVGKPIGGNTENLVEECVDTNLIQATPTPIRTAIERETFDTNGCIEVLNYNECREIDNYDNNYSYNYYNINRKCCRVNPTATIAARLTATAVAPSPDPSTSAAGGGTGVPKPTIKPMLTITLFPTARHQNFLSTIPTPSSGECEPEMNDITFANGQCSYNDSSQRIISNEGYRYKYRCGMNELVYNKDNCYVYRICPNTGNKCQYACFYNGKKYNCEGTLGDPHVNYDVFYIINNTEKNIYIKGVWFNKGAYEESVPTNNLLIEPYSSYAVDLNTVGITCWNFDWDNVEVKIYYSFMEIEGEILESPKVKDNCAGGVKIIINININN